MKNSFPANISLAIFSLTLCATQTNAQVIDGLPIRIVSQREPDAYWQDEDKQLHTVRQYIEEQPIQLSQLMPYIITQNFQNSAYIQTPQSAQPNVTYSPSVHNVTASASPARFVSRVPLQGMSQTTVSNQSVQISKNVSPAAIAPVTTQFLPVIPSVTSSIPAIKSTISTRTLVGNPILLANPVLAQNGAANAVPAKKVDAAPRLDYTTDQILVKLRAGVDPAMISRDFRLHDTGGLADAPHLRIYRAFDVESARRVRQDLGADARIESAHPMLSIKATPRAFVPNDPFFFPGSNPPVGGPGSTASVFFPGQWHLINNMPASGNNNPAINVNIQTAWNNDFTGAGVTIGIVDDAIQVTHPDLQPNNQPVAGLNRNFFGSGNNPTPVDSEVAGSHHGTAVAGLAASRGGNGLGVSGAAPLANLVGIRTEYAGAAIINALTHANGTGTTGMRIKNHSYGINDNFVANGAITVAIETSVSAGTINVYAAGNTRGNLSQDTSKEESLNTPGIVNVAALGSNGVFASYSDFGTNVLVTSPSSSNNAFLIATIDRTGNAGYNNGTSANNYQTASGSDTGRDYTNDFGGTSAAAPIVSGVLALAVQANPNVDARMAKHLLVRTSTIVDASDNTATSDGGWRANGAGFRFNQNYGYGLINASALVTAAQQFTTVTPLTTHSTGLINVNEALPDGSAGNGTFVSRTVVITVDEANRQPLEEVAVRLDITHPYRGDLEAFLQSPSGYRTRLMSSAGADSGDNITNWRFLTNAFWGENPNGTWQIDVRDVLADDLGTWNNFSIDLRMGTLIPVPEPHLVGLIAAAGLLGWMKRRKAHSTMA